MPVSSLENFSAIVSKVEKKKNEFKTRTILIYGAINILKGIKSAFTRRAFIIIPGGAARSNAKLFRLHSCDIHQRNNKSM